MNANELTSAIAALSFKIDAMCGEAMNIRVNVVGKADRYAEADRMIERRSKLREQLGRELERLAALEDSADDLEITPNVDVPALKVLSRRPNVVARLSVSTLLKLESILNRLIGQSFDIVLNGFLDDVSAHLSQRTQRPLS